MGVVLDWSLSKEVSDVVGRIRAMQALATRGVNLVQIRAIRSRLEGKDQPAVLLARVGNACSIFVVITVFAILSL